MAQNDTNTSESCSASDSLDVMRSIIDCEIAHLNESIRALKSRRNELSPISCLPAEILCKIFSFIEDDIFSSWRSPKSWTNFSRVSQHWRSTALSAPELWSKIPLSYPRRWVQEMLIRSKMAKLTIRSGPSFDTLNPKTIETVRSCLCEMDRVEELKLSAIPKLKFEDLPKSAPQLHTLYIGGPVTLSIHEDFLHDAERLQRVKLSDCKINWDSRLLTGLTCLSLHDTLKANSSTITHFFNALQRMPELTDLRLINSIPDDSEGPSIYPVVDLPCLRELCISSGVAALTTVLRHINIPHSTKLILTCRENQSTQIDFSNFLSVLATKFLSSLVFRSLGLQVLNDIEMAGLEFLLSTSAILEDRFPTSLISQSQLRLVLSWRFPQPRNHVKALTSAFDAMSLPFLTQLQISTLDYIDPETWVKTFGKLPLLGRVCVRGSAPHSFLDALVYKTEAAEKSETAYHDVSFPKLRRIDLYSTNFGVNLYARSSFISDDKLLDCLMERYERKAEIRVLRLDDCDCVSYDVVLRLREVVVDVGWDGLMQGFTDEDEENDYDSDGNTIYSDEMDYDSEYDGSRLW